MDTGSLLGLLHESVFFLTVFGIFLTLAMAKGKYFIVHIILGLYLALLITLKFPYFSFFLGAESKASDAIVMIVLFGLFTFAGTYLMNRLIPRDDYETTFEHFGKKILLAFMATALVMAYSYHALPVTDLITPGSPIQSLFAPEQNFFWWLIAPLATLFFI